MSNEITSTHEIAEQDWDGYSEPSDVDTDMVATKEPEGKGIEFHVSMRNYTMRDMEGLIIDAAAAQIVGRRNEHDIAKTIEAKCIEQVTERANAALASVTAEIIDQPLTPKYPFMKADEKPMTMREFIGLTGRDYLEATVDSSGKPTTDRHYGKKRIQYLVEQAVARDFKREIEKATSAAITEIREAIKAQHEEFLAAERKRFAEALAKTSAS